MVSVHREIETTYDADETLRLPPLVEVLRELAGDGAPTDGTTLSEGESSTQRLRATYFDTPDLRLAAAGLTLRRRTGGSDAGWHLKVPDGDGARSEIRLPAGRSAQIVPDRLRAMVHSRTGGATLSPIARIDTARTVRRVVDATGRVLLEVADDRVTARRVLSVEGSGEALGAVMSWREIEIEVVDGDAELLGALGRALVSHGLTPSPSQSKVGRVLSGGAGPAPSAKGGTTKELKQAKRPTTTKKQAKKQATTKKGATSPPLTRRSPASDVVLAYVGEQAEQVRVNDLRVRLDADGGVHAMRVATRRLRSALATFAPLLEPSTVTPLGQELKWLAGVLGQARDAEVVRARVTEAVATERPEDLLSPTVLGDVDAQLTRAWEQARDAVVAELDGERYRALLGALERLVTDPPVTARGAGPAGDVLPKLVARSLAAVARAMKKADRTEGEARIELLHDARKAAKRTRYAAEAVRPAFGKDARALAAAMEAFQEAVGHHLDTLTTRDRLRELAAVTTAPHTAFTLGRLHALADVRAQRSETDVDAAWAAASRKRLHRWLE